MSSDRETSDDGGVEKPAYLVPDTIEVSMCTNPSNDKPWLHWRNLPDVDADVMIISSYIMHNSVIIDMTVSKKLIQQGCSKDRLELAREEMDCIQDIYKQDDKRHVVYCHSEPHKAEQSKDYNLQRIRQFLMECERKLGINNAELISITIVLCIANINYCDLMYSTTTIIILFILFSAILFYTGDSQTGTGNWCFKDGFITFQDIYDVYFQCFRGRRLAIISDCSHSGNWVKECAMMYDNEKIPACGHHSREKGMLLSILTSCKSHQQATILVYVKEAMEIVASDVVYAYNKVLSSGQQTTRGTFMKILCNSMPDKDCQYLGSEYIWQNMILKRDKVRIVRGLDNGKSVWHYVILDEEKEQLFNDVSKIADRINVVEYGDILYSGWGNDPPQDIRETINRRFGYN